MAKPTLTGQSKRIARNAQGNLDSISLIPEPEPPDDDAYWTDFSQFLVAEGDASRLFYISNSGNDATAISNQHSRGYYLPTDPEIGPDPTNPVGPIFAYATYSGARPRWRDGIYPDWTLYERGGTYDLAGYSLNSTARNGGPTAESRRVYCAYGSTTLARPKFTNGSFFISWLSQGAKNLAYQSLDTTGLGGGSGIGVVNVLFEDCYLQGVGSIGDGCVNWQIRRCTVVDVWSTGDNSAFYAWAFGGGHVVDQCVFDRNGYRQNPLLPATWTGNRSGGTNDLAVGSGVQPTRTFRDRNIYIGIPGELTLTGNVFSRGGGGSSLQLRTGGVAEENVFIWNHTAFLFGGNLVNKPYSRDATFRRNTILHNDHFLPPGGSDGGVLVSTGVGEVGLIEDNIIAHFIDRVNNGDPMILTTGQAANEFGPVEQAELIRIINNDFVSPQGDTMTIRGPDLVDGSANVNVENNSIYRGSGAPVSVTNSASASWPDIGKTPGAGNKYCAPTWTGFAAWQAGGRDTQSTMYSTLADLAAASGWKTVAELSDPQGRNGWERDIVSYMQSIDPEYVVNENVTVDDGVPVANRRVSPPLVWQVLTTGSPTYNMPAMTEAEAKLTARRYHAFLTFIERARANRKGSWDSRYTAKALNNYIRAGFGRTLIA